MTTAEKVAYLKGLAEGYGIAADEKQKKLLQTVLDILEDLALDVEDLHDGLSELEDGLDAVSEDLADVEDLIFGDEDEDGSFDGLDDGLLEDDELLDADGVTFYEAKCPACGEVVTFDEGVLEQGAIECPGCGEKLEFEMGEPEG